MTFFEAHKSGSRFRKPGGLWWEWREDPALPGEFGLYSKLPSGRWVQIFITKKDVEREDYEIEQAADLPPKQRFLVALEMMKSSFDELFREGNTIQAPPRPAGLKPEAP